MIPSLFPSVPSTPIGISPMARGVKNAHRRKTRAYRANWMSGNKKKLNNFHPKNRKR
jgi:hypothetical protein